MYGKMPWSPDLSAAMSALVIAAIPELKSMQPPPGSPESGPMPSRAASCLL